MKHNPIIAIDGFSSTGKSSYAKMLAKEFGWKHIDTGAMYRAITLYGIQNNFISKESTDCQSIISNLDKISIDFRFNPETKNNDTYLNNINVETEIRSIEVSNLVSSVAAIPEIRHFLVQQQRLLSKEGGIVMDGRDIGTVVFPEADLKIFITASAEERAKRRFLEFQQNNNPVTFEEVKNNILQRDFIDQNRKISPLTPAENAFLIDNSNLNKEETYQEIVNLVQSKI